MRQDLERYAEGTCRHGVRLAARTDAEPGNRVRAYAVDLGDGWSTTGWVRSMPVGRRARTGHEPTRRTRVAATIEGLFWDGGSGTCWKLRG